MRMPFFMAGVVACGNSAGLDLDASSCSGCGAGAASDLSHQSPVPTHQRCNRRRTHRDTQSTCLTLNVEIHSFHYHGGARSTRPPAHLPSVCLCASEQARLVPPAHPKSYVVYNMQRPYQYDSASTAQSSSFPSQCLCTSIIQSQA
jgi:hypothetical protein